MYADIILPLAIQGVYTYAVPEEMQASIQCGCRVEVSFGNRKLYTGIVRRLHEDAPVLYKVKPVRALLDTSPQITETQLKFWEWIASYYMCTLGEVMQSALPAHMKLLSETCVALQDDTEIDWDALSDDEYLIMEALQLHQEKQKQKTTKSSSATSE